jgi:ubiquitin-protein ligase
MAHFINYNPINIPINPLNIPINIINPNDQIINNPNQPTRLKKHRLFLELEYLENMYQEVNVKIIRGKETIVEAKYPVEAIPKHIKFIFPKNYPFKTPDVFIINQPCTSAIYTSKEEVVEQNYLYTIHNCHLPRIHRIVKRITKTEDNTSTCLKCKSLLAHDNWSPAFKMSNIFDEIFKNNKLKRQVRIEIGLEEICKKYNALPEEIISLIRSYI